MRGLTHETPHTHEASHAQHVQPTEVHNTHATGVLPPRTVLRDDTLPQNKLDTIIEFLGFPAVGGVFLLYPAPFGGGAPVQW